MVEQDDEAAVELLERLERQVGDGVDMLPTLKNFGKGVATTRLLSGSRMIPRASIEMSFQRRS